MFTPKYPPAVSIPAAPVQPIPEPERPGAAPAVYQPAPMAPAAAGRPAIQLTPGSAVALAAGGGAVVLVVGAVLVSMLLAVAITGVSIAVTAIVLRLLVNDMHNKPQR
ncbi:SpdD protein [Streptomyces sp. NPDC047130]|uniref:SpdD protein n=1 Tax=Streptomyces sp. NPDC047130 TaxID=3155261 RepID=UPI0033F7A785